MRYGKVKALRIVVVSDTHGNFARLDDVVLEQPRADLFIHLGDGEEDVDEVKHLHPGKKFLAVAGNCDFASHLPFDGETVMCGKRIFYTHGHRYSVKSGLTSVIAQAKSRGADVLLFGHTHQPLTSYEDGLYLLNPGSLGHPPDGRATYGYIDITDAGIVTGVAEVSRR